MPKPTPEEVRAAYERAGSLRKASALLAQTYDYGISIERIRKYIGGAK